MNLPINCIHAMKDKASLEDPNWEALHALAAGQAGWFSIGQAKELGFSAQLLYHHVKAGNLEKGLRGIYRVASFPPMEHEDLVITWLWSGKNGVFSHESALLLHDLSDALPAKHHLTLPSSDAKRQLAVPPGVRLHFDDLDTAERCWMGPVPVATPARAVNETAANHGDPDLLAQAIEQGLARGLFKAWDVVEAVTYVASFKAS